MQINYCEEQVECRRVLMLTHFGEHGFNRAQCRGTCDNCRATEGQAFVEEDMSEAAKKGEALALSDDAAWRQQVAPAQHMACSLHQRWQTKTQVVWCASLCSSCPTE